MEIVSETIDVKVNFIKDKIVILKTIGVHQEIMRVQDEKSLSHLVQFIIKLP